MENREKFQSFDKLRIDPEQSRMGQRKKEIGEAGFVNKNCWLAKNINYPPSKRCQYCESKFRDCLFFRYLIVSSVLIILLLIASLLIEGKISKLVIISIFVLVIVYGYFFDKSTEKIIQANFAERKAKESLEKLAEKLEDQVKQRTKELRVANERLERLDEAKSEFLSIASHQLRTPLTTIKGMLSMALEGFWGPLNDEQKKYISQAYQGGERLLNLIEDLLDISRIEAGRIKFDFRPLSLEKMAEPIAKGLLPQAEKKNLYLKFAAPKNPLPKVRADRDKIEQVIQNLIDNAIKYTDRGGAAIHFKQEKDQVLFLITDTGLGVPEEQQTLLFKKFQRGQRAVSQYTGGSGLGLYWAEKVIRAHGGKIGVISDGENKGSTFWFSLPIFKD